MKIEDQVCSFGQAEELARLGVNIETYFEWVRLESDCIDYQSDNWAEPILMLKETRETCEAHIVFHYPAPTCSELGILLSGYQIILTPNDGWEVFDPDGFAHGFLAEYCDKLPETAARAEALIWLIDEKYIDPKDLKL
jgi:hypothetical protein